jgi:phosphoglycolate phosphatase-like HAD superfamily hydrolase
MRARNLSNTLLPDGVIIDLDGTTTKRGLVARFVDNYGGEKAVLAMINACHVSYEALKAAKQTLLPFNLHTGPLKRQILTSLAAPQMSTTPISDFFSGAGIVSGLLSNNSRYAWGERLMRHVNFGKGFDHTMYIEDMDGFSKPNPHGAFKMLQAMFPDNHSRTVWIVGDMASDMQMAVNAGEFSDHVIVPVAIGHGSARTYLNKLGLLEAERAFAFDDMDDMGAELFTRFAGPQLPDQRVAQTVIDDSKTVSAPTWGQHLKHFRV